ncbi:MAG: hypothetical protein V7754_21540 [Halioglobus sp.]
MKHSEGACAGRSISEIAIVDTFTKLIFGQESAFEDAELDIIQALRQIDSNVALDAYPQMGVYLRALGVREMIHLVSRVREGMTSGFDIAAHNPDRGYREQTFN